MENNSMDSIKEIAERIKGLRDAFDVTAQEMAKELEMSVEDYLKYEEGNIDFSFSFLYSVANVLKIDITDLIMGESAKLNTYCYVPAGEGITLRKSQEYEYRHLAYLFKNKKLEPFFVTVEPTDIYSSTDKKSHEGQEFNYILEGSMTIYIGDESVYLKEGDSIYFNSIYPHAMKAENDKTCKYLAIIAK